MFAYFSYEIRTAICFAFKRVSANGRLPVSVAKLPLGNDVPLDGLATLQLTYL
ncbi:hypothetical protein L7Q78_33345 [Achromobacter xylosoxidans]|nr:hypothetical protein [Achromobacter xylosoxidans]